MGHGFAIQAKAAKQADVYIYENVGAGLFYDGITAKQFAQEIRALGELNALDVHINSDGGDVFEGFGIYNTLNQLRARITTYVDGIAASIASVIAMAGAEIVISETASMMLHEPMGGVMGTADRMEAYAANLRRHRDIIAKVYADRTGNSVDQLRRWMGADPTNLGTWFNADEAIANKFATRKVDNMKVAALSPVPRSVGEARHRYEALMARMAARRAEQAEPIQPSEADRALRARVEAMVANRRAGVAAVQLPTTRDAG